MSICIDRRWFKDEHGRTLLLRGVNLGGSTKVPRTPDGATHIREGFFDHRNVSFVGRPFSLEEADEHFTRLRNWGFTFLRFLVTWEAIEHAGPGIYDEAYLDYLYAVVKKAAEYDISLFIDPHQDVWSRFTGGDGAPGWTFDVVGMDMTKFKTTGAAITHQESKGDYPRMIWPSNYAKFAAATMFTLFYGGHDFAPETKVDGVPVQEFLQGHYINAIKQVALRLKNLPNVVGYDTLNEPSLGYIGYEHLNVIPAEGIVQGSAPTILQSMLLASGYPQVVLVKSLLPWQRKKKTLLNPDGISLWKEGYDPIWRRNGVWDVDQAGRPVVLRPDHFHRVNGRTFEAGTRYFTPAVERFIRELRAVHPTALFFVDPPVIEFQSSNLGSFAPTTKEDIVHAPHWYNGVVLGFQRYIPWLGLDTAEGKLKLVLRRGRVQQNLVAQVKRLVERSEEMFGSVPTLIGETGIAYNLNGGAAYRTADFSAQVGAMNDTMQVMEANLVSVTIWNYTADNSNVHGDQWNDEDLSIFSRDQQTDPADIHSGGRALEAAVRPYARAVAGEPLRMHFDPFSRI
ncbi:MAG: cellulase family glycosylhydrolase, partial [Chloroflexota bacterium]|nr:cellulase family glycosylhydrolase [Chloroflexota bacterium]